MPDELDGAIGALNMLHAAQARQRSYRVLRYGAACVAYSFDGIAALHADAAQTELIHRIAALHGARTTVLDLSGCLAASSTALGLWADIINRARLAGGQVALIAPGEFVQRALAMVGLDRLCHAVSDIEAALAWANRATGVE